MASFLSDNRGYNRGHLWSYQIDDSNLSCRGSQETRESPFLQKKELISVLNVKFAILFTFYISAKKMVQMI